MCRFQSTKLIMHSKFNLSSTRVDLSQIGIRDNFEIIVLLYNLLKVLSGIISIQCIIYVHMLYIILHVIIILYILIRYSS